VTYFILLMWIVLSSIAVFLAAIARRNPQFYFTDGTPSKSLKFWFASMLLLDAAVFFVGIVKGYNPPYFLFGMLLVIQWAYLLPAIYAYFKLMREGNQFSEAKASRKLRNSPIGVSSMNTMLLAISLELMPFEMTNSFFLIFFAMGIFFSGLDFLFFRLLKLRQDT